MSCLLSGILRSEDNGKTWIELIDGMNGNPISIIKFRLLHLSMIHLRSALNDW